MSQQEKYSIHVLEMVRNNGIAEDANDCSNHFFMFDYFDVLYHKKLTDKDKNYEKYLSIKDPFENYQNYKVSYKVLSLYQFAENVQGDPFQVYDGEGLSETPFIGIIQITLCKENYEDGRKAEDIVGFLCDCEGAILNIADTCLEEEDCCVMAKQLYRSSTTGDFCLVLRTDSIEAVYRVALALNDTQCKASEGIRLFTYTNVGIECKAREDGSYCTLSNEFIERHQNLMFALRFSAATQFEEQLEQYIRQREAEKAAIEKVKGLFGRYDYLIHIDMEEFAEVYPVLCEKKLGIISKCAEEKPEKKNVECGNDVMALSQIIRYFTAQNINERILVNLSDLNISDNTVALLEEERKRVIEKNKIMFNKIKKLDKWRRYFANEYREFQELFHYMREMCKTFLPIGMEKEGYINWVVFWKDMDVLCDCINEEMESYQKLLDCDEEELGKLRQEFLISWRANIQAINQYTRLIQNVNYQTYQAPIYEIQTQIDTEKAMTAYREVMENYLFHWAEDPEGDIKQRDHIFALIFPEMMKQGVEVVAPFSARMSANTIQREVYCTVPSFDYFGRLYDLLPWIVHECSHQMRVLDRKDRNEFVVKYILDGVFKNVVSHIFMRISADIMYGQMDQWGQELVNDMVDIASEEIFSEEKDIESDFEQTIQGIRFYLTKIFAKRSKFLEERERCGEDIVFIRKKIVEELLTNGRSNNLIDDTYLNLVAAIKKKSNALWEVQEIVKRLLQSYREQLEETLKRNGGLENSLSDEWVVQSKDMNLPIDKLNRSLMAKVEKIEICTNKSMESLEVLKSYCFAVKKVYRLQKKYKKIVKISSEDNYINNLLEKVFERYQNRHKKTDDIGREKNAILNDPSTVSIMRNIGLQNWDKKTFCDSVKSLIREKSIDEMINVVQFKEILYRETCADLFMTTSLQINSFGYCRQVFQTISDTSYDEEDLYDGINSERFRIVTAVLLQEEVARENETEDDEAEVYVEGKTLIKQSKVYCENTLKCIRDIVLKRTTFRKNEKVKRLKELLGVMNKQLGIYLDNMSKEVFQDTLLYSLLHENSKNVKEEVKSYWEKYEDIREELKGSHHQFVRLERLCIGLNKIMTGGCVVAPKEAFHHMQKIRKEAKSVQGKGCRWEDAIPECLIRPKLNVGCFYNEPEQVYTLSTDQKLENTIDFIQNYYYYNRFRIMEREQAEKQNDEEC